MTAEIEPQSIYPFLTAVINVGDWGIEAELKEGESHITAVHSYR